MNVAQWQHAIGTEQAEAALAQPILVWDCETLEEMIDDEHRHEDRDAYMTHAGIAVAVVLNRNAGTYHFFTSTDEEGSGHSLVDLVNMLSMARLVISFNGKRFDNKVLGHATGRAAFKPKLECDVSEALFKTVGYGWGKGAWNLDAVCQRTLGGRGKTADGVFAPTHWKRGNLGHVISYCWNDVKLLDELEKFIRRYGYVVGPDARARSVRL